MTLGEVEQALRLMRVNVAGAKAEAQRMLESGGMSLLEPIQGEWVCKALGHLEEAGFLLHLAWEEVNDEAVGYVAGRLGVKGSDERLGH